MSIKTKFVENGIKKPEIEEFLRKHFERCGYSHSEIRKTPVGVRITVYANRPGLVIGKGGENINKISEMLEKEFNLENPRIDVQEISNPYLNAKIVAEEIKNGLERGGNYRKIGNIMLRRIMESGAMGAEIRISGKLGSARGRTQRFYEGYLKYSGETAKKYVDYAFTSALTKAGAIGIKVRILKENPEAVIAEIKKAIKESKEKKEETKGEFVCPYCGKVYDNERSLKIHIGQKHSEEGEK
ncbi:MAG: 30S ribosomal protein S3 [Candidatus Aenigmarchaeota archaeon]|nr:30S ribosomal protein S3 [Candidatus Aenigmarchaeota archaeon]